MAKIDHHTHPKEKPRETTKKKDLTTIPITEVDHTKDYLLKDSRYLRPYVVHTETLFGRNGYPI